MSYLFLAIVLCWLLLSRVTYFSLLRFRYVERNKGYMKNIFLENNPDLSDDDIRKNIKSGLSLACYICWPLVIACYIENVRQGCYKND